MTPTISPTPNTLTGAAIAAATISVPESDLSHDFIKTGDPDATQSITDSNGEVVLGVCRRCGQAEGDLELQCPAALAQPMATAPRDDVMIRLLVHYSENPIDDGSGPFWTIGSHRPDGWVIAGWDWCNDQITAGAGNPIGWLPLDPRQTMTSDTRDGSNERLDAALTAAVQSERATGRPDDRVFQWRDVNGSWPECGANTDRRMCAVEILLARGWHWTDGAWVAPAFNTPTAEALLELAIKLETWRPQGLNPIGPLHSSGMVFAYKDAAGAIRRLIGAAHAHD